MARLCVFSLGFQGHVNPLLGVAKELVALGHEVTFYTTEDHAAQVRATGARLRPYASSFDKSFVFPRAPSGKTPPYHLVTLQEARRVMAQVVGEIEKDRPDAILYEAACLAGRFLAEALAVPGIKLFPSYASTETYSPFEAGRKLFLSDPELKQAYDDEVARLVAEFGVKPPTLSSGHVEKLNIVFMSRIFHPSADRFDDRFVFVGPSLRNEASAALPLPRAGQPLLYVSLGTLNNDWPEFFEKCGEAFATGWQVVMAVGHHAGKQLAEKLPSHFIVRQSVPQLEVLAVADIFLTQGGMNSCQESLYHGVPLVVCPSTPEQSLTADRIEQLGLGVKLGFETVTPFDLQRAVEKVAADPNFGRNAKLMSRHARFLGGARRAAREITDTVSSARVA